VNAAPSQEGSCSRSAAEGASGKLRDSLAVAGRGLSRSAPPLDAVAAGPLVAVAVEAAVGSAVPDALHAAASTRTPNRITRCRVHRI